MELKIAAASNTPPWQSELSALPEEQKIDRLFEKLNTLCGLQLWSFGSLDDTWAFTTKPRSEHPYTLTALHPYLIKYLAKDDITPAESFSLQFQVTALVINDFYLPSDVQGVPEHCAEPFIDFDAIAEGGEAMEHRIFGGCVSIFPASIPLAGATSDWPSERTGGEWNRNHPAYQKTKDVTRPFPALHISRLFTAEFWDNPYVPRKSDPSFWHANMFRSGELDETNENDWDRFDRAIAGAWRESQQQWDIDRRSWFRPYYKRWVKTPWGMNFFFRRKVDVFARNFEESDEFLCYPTASQFVSASHWQDKEAFFKKMPTNTKIEHAWVYFTIGLLMLAAMPIRTAKYSEKNPDANKFPYFIFTPGLECQRALQERGGTAPRELQYTTNISSPSEFYERAGNIMFNPFNPDDTVHLEREMSQMKYLDLVNKTLNHIKEVQAYVSGPWYRQIELSFQELLAQRQEIISEYPQDHYVRWAKRWPFSVPEFDPHDEDWIRWNRRDQTWNHYPILHSYRGIVEESPPPPSPTHGSPDNVRNLLSTSTSLGCTKDL
ncbi:hypothetical protein F4823DRAFT_558971 [Ustulina deusta]|nr:hypothetical protein F4823DRAFT_558971 [Ustulina deusta]